MNVGFHSFFFFRSREGGNQSMLRSHNHIGSAKQSIAAGGINAELVFRRFAVCISDCKINFCAQALADPVFLHVLDALRPIQFIQAF